MPTIWPHRRTIRVRRPVAETAAADFAPPSLPAFTAANVFTGRLDPEADPSYCCEDCEAFTRRILRARAAVDNTEALLADLARELVELEQRHEEARRR